MRVSKGQKFGRLVITVIYPPDLSKKHYYQRYTCKCDCECGNDLVVRVHSLIYGHTKSCGCLASDTTALRNATHGDCSSSEYRVWSHIKWRVLNKTGRYYKNYGGRGIKMCERWMCYDNFLEDMGRRPTKKHSIGRIDNNGHYEPSNCRWETQKSQMRNTRRNLMITYMGKTQCLVEWSEELGLDQMLIRDRIKKLGWTPEEALTKPARKLTKPNVIQMQAEF